MEGSQPGAPVLLSGLDDRLARALIRHAPPGLRFRMDPPEDTAGPAVRVCGDRRPRAQPDDLVLILGEDPDGVADLALPVESPPARVIAAVELARKALSAEHWRRTAERLRWHDPVTGRPHPGLLDRHLQQLIRRARRLGIACGLLAMEVPELEAIRMVEGDEELQHWRRWLVARLEEAAGPASGLAVDGDTRFHIVVPDLPAGEAGVRRLREVAERLLGAAAGPPGRHAPLALRVGCAVFPSHARDAAMLVRQSRAALAGTLSGSDPLRMADAALIEDAGSGLERHLHALRAIESEAWSWCFQPLTGSGGQVVGAEALLRPRALDLDAGALFKAARAAGRVPALADAARRSLWPQVARLRGVMDAGFRVALNLAPEEPGPGLDRELAWALPAHGLGPEDLVLEVTEETAAELEGGALEALAESGFELAVDDFGTGRSSLARLRASPFRVLKLDRSFMQGVPASRRDCRLIQAVREMATGLGLKTVAEGVETEDQLRFVREEGFDVVQGYFTGRPVGLERFLERYGRV